MVQKDALTFVYRDVHIRTYARIFIDTHKKYVYIYICMNMYVHIHTCTYIHIETPGTTYPPSKLVPGDNWAQCCAAPVPCLGERLDMISPAIGRRKYMYTCTYRHIPSEPKPIRSTPEKTRLLFCVWETILFYNEGTNWETLSSINWHIMMIIFQGQTMLGPSIP